jgi:hypothetical protein
MLEASMAHDLHLIALDPILISPASTLIFILSNNSTKLCGNGKNFSHNVAGYNKEFEQHTALQCISEGGSGAAATVSMRLNLV